MRHDAEQYHIVNGNIQILFSKMCLRDRSNSPPGIVPPPDHGGWLEIQYCKGGIPTATPLKLASQVLSLPPILYMQYRIPVPNWSKAPWGLSVLARVTSIFTGTSISPDALSRQCSNHYACLLYTSYLPFLKAQIPP